MTCAPAEAERNIRSVMENKSMQSKLFIATKAIIVYKGKILILREAGKYSEGTNVGKYDVPGGRLNPGEHFLEALEREILEETGLSVKVGSPLTVGEWFPVVHGEPWQVVGVFFLCEAASSEVTLSEDHDDFQWIEPIAYSQYQIIDNLIPVFEEYLKRQ